MPIALTSSAVILGCNSADLLISLATTAARMPSCSTNWSTSDWSSRLISWSFRVGVMFYFLLVMFCLLIVLVQSEARPNRITCRPGQVDFAVLKTLAALSAKHQLPCRRGILRGDKISKTDAQS